MDALDLSNNTTHFTVDQVQQWKAEGIGLAIVQLISGVRLAGEDCAAQIRTCLDGGLAVDCYLFPGNDGLALTTSDRLALVPDDLKPLIRQVWIDVEPAYRDPDQAAIDAAHADCDAWAPWQRTGDYSALWVADRMGWHPWPWPDRKQWLVYLLNSGARNLGGTFDGTDAHAMTQYQMDVTLAGVSGMDRSALTDAEEQAVTVWLNGGNTPMPDVDQPWQDKKALVVQLAGELKAVAGQIRAAGNRKYGPVRADVLPLADAVEQRADEILA